MEIVEAGFRQSEKTYELESIEGGWVTLKRLNHGQSNELADLRLTFVPGRGEGEDENTATARTSIKIGRHYSFSRCISNHNLGADGKKFDFSKRRDVDALDPTIGDEVADLIDKHNETIEGTGDIPNSSES